MAQPKVIRKTYQPQAGLDLRTSMMERQVSMCSSMANLDFIHTDDGDAITQRPGFQKRYTPITTHLTTWAGSVSTRIYYSCKHTRISPSTGLEINEQLLIGNHLYRMRNDSITLYYSGAGAATASVVVSGGAWRMHVKVNGSIVTSGDVSLSQTIRNVSNFVNSNLTNFTMIYGAPDAGAQREAFINGNQVNVNTIVVDNGSGGNHNFRVGDMLVIRVSAGTDTHRKATAVTGTTISFDGASISVTDNDPVRFYLGNLSGTIIESVIDRTVSAAGTTFAVLLEDSAYPPVTVAPFVTTVNAANNDEFRHPSSVNINNCTFVSLPLENTLSLIKYDGQNFYTPGMPKADAPTVVDSGVGAGLAAGTYKYLVTWIQKDAQNNIIEGIASDIATVVMGNNDATVTLGYTQITAAMGYLAANNKAQVVGNQVGVTTVNVDDGAGGDHTIHVGDVVYLLNRATGAYVEKTIISATYPSTGGTITFSGAVNVNDNDYITVNSRAAIYRTKVGGATDFFLVNEIPFGYTTYTDSTPDASLGAQYLFPEPNTEHGIPPANPFYLAGHQGSLVIGGVRTSPSKCYYSLPGSPEYFPTNLNFTVSSGKGQIVSGIASNEQFLLVFKEDSTHIVSGQLLDPFLAVPAFRVDLLDQSTGLIGHLTVQNVEGSLIYLSRQGPMIQNGGSKPELLLDVLSPVFTENPSKSSTTQLQYLRSTAIYDSLNKKYILYMPAEDASVNGGNSSSRIFVFDVRRKQWREWTNINMAANAVEMSPGEIYFTAWNGSAVPTIYKFLSFGTSYDLTDDTAAINLFGVFGWESLGEPGAYKKWLRTQPYVPLSESPSFTLTWETHIDWKNTAQTSGSFVFSGTELPGALRHYPTKAVALRHKFSHSTIYERVLLLGWDDEVVASYVPALKEGAA